MAQIGHRNQDARTTCKAVRKVITLDRASPFDNLIHLITLLDWEHLSALQVVILVVMVTLVEHTEEWSSTHCSSGRSSRNKKLVERRAERCQ